MSDSDSYEVLPSLPDEDTYYLGDGSLSPSLRGWASGSTDYEDFDIDSLNLSSVPSSDFLEEAITATRNGEAPVLSTVSQFAGILSQTGIHGPRLLKALNLGTRASKIGAGAQFTVFKEKADEGYTGNEGLVIKRVNVPLSSKKDQRFAASPDYRLQLRTLGLELLALCNPVLRSHPNIVRLMAWGYDYPFADMPVPVLFVEAALMPLTDFLRAHSQTMEKPTCDVEYQLSLDIANGIEALHHLHIVHGDLKPDNVLVFNTQSEKVPFRAKLSDFGVCIDLEAPDSRFTMSDYRGTPAWLAPEVANEDLARFCPFYPDLMFRFDAYSFGLTLLSIFTKNGEPPVLDEDPSNAAEEVFEMLYSRDDIPSALRMELRKSIQKLLAEDPRKRPLPSQSLLKTDTQAYASWLSLSEAKGKDAPHVGTIDPMYNKGPLFWYRLDPIVLAELEEQYVAVKEGTATEFPGAVLFGMAQTVTGAKPAYLDRLLLYLTDAAKAGFSPARAVYAQIMAAHGRKPDFDAQTLEEWADQAVSEGYLFAHSSALSDEKLESAKAKFRMKGGFCADPFLGKPRVLEAARDRQKALTWQKTHGAIVDHRGNTILHAAAALGELDVVRGLLDDAHLSVDVENDNQETPLYKACQAGHVEMIEFLLDRATNASHATRQAKITPLHWLFLLPEQSIHHIATRLITAGADVNSTIEPAVSENSGGFPERIQILHYPFELPHGTPLHWAAFFRNTTAMDALLGRGANVNATYHSSDGATTPLALTAWFGDLPVARYLVSKGADGTLKDSMGRNALHAMTKYFPERHGYLPHHWHAWIRQGDWSQYLEQITGLTKLLMGAGAEIDAKDTAYPSMTPIAAAADLGVWNGGVICALLEVGADLQESTISMGDSVLHSWASIVGPRLDYPCSYMYTLRQIVNSIPDIDVRNKYENESPLHSLATTYHPEPEFEEACSILLSHNPPADLNAKTHRGSTPLSIALETKDAPARRGLFLLSKGANIYTTSDQGKDIFFSIANNPTLHDEDTTTLIKTFLTTLDPHTEPAKTYQAHFFPNPSSVHALFASAERGKPLTTTLLLNLGLNIRINDPNNLKSPPITTLDHALHAAELSRRAHMEKLSTHKPGPAQRHAIQSNLVYDDQQGPPARAAEAYNAFPDVIRCLRRAGAKRACELDPVPDSRLLDTVYIQQGQFWDWVAIYGFGFTPATQPGREHWGVLYELAMYPDGWREEQVRELCERYGDGIWRPDVRFLEGEEDRGFVEEV
ncbi:hypothetical protein BBP40_009195, partial [Aspergillus hancockii]